MTAPQSAIVRLTAQPRLLSDGSLQTLRMAGGGNRSPYYFGGVHFRAGVVDLPRFSVSFGWDENGWNGSARPQIANLAWSPSLPADYSAYANNYLWKDAPITAEIGLEQLAGAEPSSWSAVLTGKIQQVAASSGQLTFTIADNGAALDKPLVTKYFAGTGGVEGPAEAEGREKRRNYGYVFNVEGRILDKVNNIWEFGDPAQQLQAISAVRDIGRAASPAPTSVAWQGSVAATFTALQAASAAQGSGVVAPSIGCVKWWTQPVGPLTADLIGAGDYGNTACALAKHLAVEAGLTMSAVPAGVSSFMANTANAGVHIGDDGMTVANAIDRLLLGAGLFWRFAPAGTLEVTPIHIDSPTETILADNIQRRQVFPPHRLRRMGYMRNERQMSPSELAASVLLEDLPDLSAPVAVIVPNYVSPNAGQNRVRFSRWEKGEIGWTFTTSGATLNAKAIYHPPDGGVSSDQAAINITFTGAGQQGKLAPNAFAEGGEYQYTIPVTAGERIFVSGELWPQTMPAAGRCYLFVSFWTAAHAIIGGGLVAGNILTSDPGAWSRQGAFFTVPATAAWVYVQPILDNVGSGGVTAVGSALNLRKLMVCGAAPSQTAWPDWSEGPSSESGAELNIYVQPPTQSLDFNYDYTGTAVSGEFPRDISMKLFNSAGQITGGVTWDLAVVSGGFNSVTAASGRFGVGTSNGIGTQQIASLETSEAVVELRAAYAGRFYKTNITLKKIIAPAPPSGGGGGGGGGTIATDTTFVTFSGTTFVDVSGTIPATQPAGATSATIAVNIKATPSSGTSGSWTCELRLMRLISGVWTQIGSTQSAGSLYQAAGGGEPASAEPAFFNLSFSDTGLTGGTAYDRRIEMRLTSGSRTHNVAPNTSGVVITA